MKFWINTEMQQEEPFQPGKMVYMITAKWEDGDVPDESDVGTWSYLGKFYNIVDVNEFIEDYKLNYSSKEYVPE